MIRNGYNRLSKPLVGTPLDPSAPQSRGLVAYWPFNENSGNLCYDAVGTNHFTLSGGVTRVAGPQGTGIKFDGSTGQALSASSPLSGASQFTILMRTRIQNTPTSMFLSGNTAYNGSFYAYYDAGIGLSLYLNNNKTFTQSTPFPSSGTYDHFVITYSGSGLANTVQHYHNGVLSASVAPAQASVAAHTALLLGRDAAAANPSDAVFESLKIYSRVLTQAEIIRDIENPFGMWMPPNVRRFYAAGGASPATGTSLAGPASGAPSTPSTNFTVALTPGGGTVAGTVTVTPSDGGAGGTFTPASVGLTTGSPSATFTYTPTAATGARTISITNNGGLTNANPLTYTVNPPVATALTLSGPAVGLPSVASTPFTVQLSPNGGTVAGTVTVTPSDGGAGGTFTPVTVGLTTGSPSATFTYTPTSALGARTITVTNNGGLTNPGAATYTVVASLPAGGPGGLSLSPQMHIGI